jgi:hypothetical protein
MATMAVDSLTLPKRARGAASGGVGPAAAAAVSTDDRQHEPMYHDDVHLLPAAPQRRQRGPSIASRESFAWSNRTRGPAPHLLLLVVYLDLETKRIWTSPFFSFICQYCLRRFSKTKLVEFRQELVCVERHFPAIKRSKRKGEGAWDASPFHPQRRPALSDPV